MCSKRDAQWSLVNDQRSKDGWGSRLHVSLGVESARGKTVFRHSCGPRIIMRATKLLVFFSILPIIFTKNEHVDKNLSQIFSENS
jgi:hypothetical protein